MQTGAIVLLHSVQRSRGLAMDFGSEYVYQYPNSDEEVVSDEEFEAGIDNAR